MSWTVHTLTATGGANCLCEPHKPHLTRFILLHEHMFFVLFNVLRALPTCCIIINFPTPKQWSILRTCTAAHVCCIITACSIMFTVSGHWHQPTGIGYGLCSETREPRENAMQLSMCRTTCCRRQLDCLHARPGSYQVGVARFELKRTVGTDACTVFVWGVYIIISSPMKATVGGRNVWSKSSWLFGWCLHAICAWIFLATQAFILTQG